MTRLLEVQDAESWDRFVSASTKPHIFQSWGWGEIKSRTGWRPCRLALEREGLWRVGLSILERDFPRIGKRFFYAPRGPVTGEGWSRQDLEALFQVVEERAKARRAVFLKIDPDVTVASDWVRPVLMEAGFTRAPETGGFSGVQPRWVFRLGIDRTEEELLKAMDQKTRYNIRLAEKKGVAIRPIQERSDIETFFKVLAETAQRDRFLIRPVDYFHAIQECLGPRGQAQYFLAEREGRALGGALALAMGPVAWYIYGASSNEGRNYMPNHLMQWTLIRWAKSKGCRLYDFRAVPSNPSPEDPLYGLFRFKKGFGGELTEFVGEFDRVYSPWFYKLWVHGWPLFKSLRKKVLQRRRNDTAPMD
ncbi:MAG: peptidoglycan bridge formation glycyltransferase FemA/FemB family protein [Elusimicrobia bacterium]|nr:peptidoglycan bridge formation glycyltransferase FemA/FemB family protein [Elusimicrobiota bacterium]